MAKIMPTPAPLTDTQRAWLREHGVRRSPTGQAYYAETRGGHGHPLPLAVVLVAGAWELRLRRRAMGRYTTLRRALAALLEATRLDSYEIGSST